MSRFWGATSDSESDEEDSLKSEEEEDKGEEEGEEEKTGTSFFDRPDSDEDEPEVKRFVRSQKDKRNEAVSNAIQTIKNGIVSDDWDNVQKEFDELIKIVQKSLGGTEKPVTPRSFIRCMVHLEDAVEEAWAKDKKKPGLSALKQKLRKHKQAYEKEIEDFRQSPVDTDQSDEEKKNEEEKPEAEEGPEEEELKPEDVDKKVKEILSTRGKRNINSKKQIGILSNLFQIAEGTVSPVKTLLALIAIRFDQTMEAKKKKKITHMKIDTWRRTREDLIRILGFLDQDKTLVITTSVEDDTDENSEIVKKAAEAGKVLIPGSLVAVVEKLDDEFIKSLQNIDPHTTDYIERLRDEASLYELIVRVQLYYERPEPADRDIDSLTRTVIKRVEHLYYKSDSINNPLETKVLEKLNKSTDRIDCSNLVHQLCSFLYKNGSDLIRIRALLYHVFHHALHDRYFKARDMLLMSHLQETIQHADISTQILYNRAMVQTGLCAFRHGMLKESQNALQDIYASGKAKELLAQGIVTQKNTEKTSEQEQLEKLRQIPFHMHINLELLECIYLTCSLILEVPFMASGNFEARRRVVSKPFRRILDYTEKQLFTGPPENTREHIMQAAKALMSGDWERSIKLISAIKVWDLMSKSDEIKAMLARKIQDSGLQTYLLSYSNYYETLSLAQLSELFKLSKTAVHGIVSKMIINEDLHATLDQVSDMIVIHKVEPTRLQHLALQFADKASYLIENNEKILEIRTGNLGSNDRNQGNQNVQQTYQGRQPYQNRQQGGNRMQNRRQLAPAYRMNNPGGNQRYLGQNQNQGYRQKYQENQNTN